MHPGEIFKSYLTNMITLITADFVSLIFFASTCTFQICSLRALLINSESSIHILVIAVGIVICCWSTVHLSWPVSLEIDRHNDSFICKVFAWPITWVSTIETKFVLKLNSYIHALIQKRIIINYHVCSYTHKQQTWQAVVGIFNNRRFHPCTCSTSITRKSCEEMHKDPVYGY